MESTTLELVTPDMAAAWLLKNKRNRKLNQNDVDNLTDIIRNGLWRITNQGIGFGADGELYDGQHRLAAIVKSGIAVQVLVTRGLAPSARDAIDNGSTRKPHDILAITDGVTTSTIERAAVWVALQLSTLGNLTTHTGKLTVHDLRDAFKEHGDDMRAVLDALGPGHDRLTNAAMVGALVVAHRTEPDKVVLFTKLLRVGAGLTETHPALALRNFLTLSYTSKHGQSRDDLVTRTLTAFDAYVVGREIKRLHGNMAAREKYLKPWKKT